MAAASQAIPVMATTVFKDIRVFDGEKVHQSATVVVKNGKISSVSASPPSNIEGGATTVDGTGHTLLPGLIEAHMHAHLPPGKGTVQTTHSRGRVRSLRSCWSITKTVDRPRNPEASHRLRHYHMFRHAQYA